MTISNFKFQISNTTKLGSNKKPTAITIFLSIVLFCLFIITPVGQSYAKVTPSPSTSPSPSVSPTGKQNSELMNKIDQQINALKTKIVSQTAKLNLVEKRGIVGTVDSASGTQIKLTDTHNAIRFVDVDELTKFSSPSAKGTFGISDLTNGTTVGVLGDYNKNTQRILARFVDVLTFPQTVSGNISSVDNKNYQFNVVTTDQTGKQITRLIDVETVSKTYTYTATDGEKKAGFSKISNDERVYVIGFPDKTNHTMIIASRIILLPELSPNASPSISSRPTVTPTPTKKK